MHERDGGIEIPAGETVMLKPGGLHIMFMGLGETMVAGEMRKITLEFASGHKATVPAMVLKPGDIKSGGHGHDRSDEHSAGHKHKHSHD
jgi:copper(I)-binding protein